MCPHCHWGKLEMSFKSSVYLTEFQERTIKLNTTRRLFSSAKVYYCWSTPQDFDLYQDTPINLGKHRSFSRFKFLSIFFLFSQVFICGETLSTCTYIHTALKREAVWDPTNDVSNRVPEDFDMDCAIFWFDDVISAKQWDRMNRTLEQNFTAYKPAVQSAFVGVVNFDLTNKFNPKSKEMVPQRESPVQYRHLEVLYMRLYQVVHVVLLFRLGRKLPKFRRELLPSRAIKSEEYTQYETLDVSDK